MASIKSLEHDISQLNQKKEAKLKEIDDLHRDTVQEAATGDPNQAVNNERTALKYHQDIEELDKQIKRAEQQIVELEREITNIDAEMTRVQNQHAADLARLEQQLKIDLQQLESQKARTIG